MSETEPYRGAPLDVDWHAVYTVWAYDCNQNDRCAAEKMGLSRRTVAYHKMQEGWLDRYTQDHYGVSESELSLAKIALRSLCKEGVQERLRSIIMDRVPVTDLEGRYVFNEDGTQQTRWRSSDRDAVNAMRIVATYTLDINQGDSLSVPISAAFHVNETLSEQEQAIAILEDNAATTNTRVKRDRKRV